MNTASARSRCRAFKIKSQSRHFGSSGADKPLCDPIRRGRLKRRPNDSDVFGLEDGIKAARELAIVIADQKTNRFGTFGERPGHLPRLLGDPVGVGVGRAPARWTRRLPTSMKNSTYNRRSQTVSTVKN